MGVYIYIWYGIDKDTYGDIDIDIHTKSMKIWIQI